MKTTDGRAQPATGRTGALVAVAAIGFALAAAPGAFQMFTRAPAGGDMIDDFDRYMTVEEIDTFRSYLELVDAADAEASDQVFPALVAAGAVASDEVATTFDSNEGLHTQWPGIDADMTDLLDTMQANLGNFDSVASLPPFALFPWFFFVPGMLVGVGAIVVLVGLRRGRSVRVGATVLVALGLCIALAPAVFQMFSRAPDGAAMIDDFRPMMTPERVTGVQGYFITMGAAEGELRNKVLPLAAEQDDPPSVDAATRFSAEWQTIVGDFAPMVATMSDNVDNFEGIDALPPFSLFPWFFVLPGLMIAALAFFVRASNSAALPNIPDERHQP